MDISMIIKEAREKKRMTQEQVAKAIGVSRNAVTNWENNTSQPRRDTALLLCELLEIPTGLLVPIHSYALDVVDQDANGFTIDVIEEEDIQNYFDNKLASASIMKLWVSTNESLAKNSIGIVVKDTSLQPVVNPGDTIIFQKNLSPRNGDIILCFHNEKSKYFIRNYKERGEDADGELYYDITAEQPNVQTHLCSNKNCRIIGVAVEHRRKFRRTTG